MVEFEGIYITELNAAKDCSNVRDPPLSLLGAPQVLTILCLLKIANPLNDTRTQATK